MGRLSVTNIFRKYMMEIILLLLFILLAVFAPGFIRGSNLLGILRNMAIVGVIAFGMTMVIISGEIDLSVGSSIAFYCVLLATFTGTFEKAGIPRESGVLISIAITLIISIGVGVLNGLIRTKFGVPSFIITLAMLNVLYGLSAIISNGFPITTFPSWYNNIGAGQLFGIPLPALWLAIVFIVVFIVMNYTRFGREVYAVGGNQESARLSGINVNKVKVLTLTAVQFLAALASIIMSSQVMAGSSTFGKGYEMDVISSVIIGGASLNGGIRKVWGTFIGIIFLGILINGMTLLRFDDYVKYVVRGALILVAVLINTIQVRNMQKA